MLILMIYEFAAPISDRELLFTRLANMIITDGSTIYLYHQMNGSTFAEEQWDDTLHAWLPPRYVNVLDF